MRHAIKITHSVAYAGRPRHTLDICRPIDAAAAPSAAIEEYDNGRGDGVNGPTNVQRVPRTPGVGDGIRDLDGTPHAGGSKNSIGPNEGKTAEVIRRDEDDFRQIDPAYAFRPHCCHAWLALRT